jgi:hypothetical protein
MQINRVDLGDVTVPPDIPPMSNGKVVPLLQRFIRLSIDGDPTIGL